MSIFTGVETYALKKDEESITSRVNEEKMKKHMEQLLLQRDQLQNKPSDFKDQIEHLTLSDFNTISDELEHTQLESRSQFDFEQETIMMEVPVTIAKFLRTLLRRQKIKQT